MPNHVCHKMVIEGTDEQILELWGKLNPKPEESGRMAYNLFDALLPMPKEYEGTVSGYNGKEKYTYPELVAKYGANDWYEWCCDNWGTKWGSYETDIYRVGNVLILKFSTAWSCPHEFYSKYLANYTFRYRANEEGCENLFEGDNESSWVAEDPVEFLVEWVTENGGDISDYLIGNYDYVDHSLMADEWVEALV